MDDHRATEEDGAASLRGIVTPSVSAVGAGSAGEMTVVCRVRCAWRRLDFLLNTKCSPNSPFSIPFYLS